MNVLFVQGGGAGAYDEDAELAVSLQRALGASFTVRYPKMPDEGAPEYTSRGPKVTEELSALGGAVVLVGHSARASVRVLGKGGHQFGNDLVGVVRDIETLRTKR